MSTDPLSMKSCTQNVFFENSIEMLCVANHEGYFVDLNPRWSEVLGYSNAELMGKPFIEFVHPDDLEATMQEAAKLNQDAEITVHFENRYLTKDGHWIWLAWNARTVGDQIYAAARDITDLKNQQRYNFDMQEAAKIGYWRIDLATNTPNWSDITYDIHDVERGSEIDMSKALDFYPEGEPRNKITRLVEDGIENGTPWDVELPFITSKGRHLWVRAIGKPIMENGKVVELYGVFQDITENKEIEIQHKYLIEEAGDGFWDWHIQDEYEYMSPRFWEILGYSPEEKKHHPDEWKEHIFEEDLQEAVKVFDRHVASRGRHPYWMEARYRHKDGSTVWVICRGKVIEWEKDGSPIRMIGSHTDITQLKKAQLQLTENAKMAALGEMAGGIAHEINNPLAIIANSAEALKYVIDGKSNNIQFAKRALENIDSTVERISKIISGMRMLLRNENIDDKKMININYVIEETLSLCREKVRLNSIDLRYKNPQQEIYCQLNLTQISQIVLNLLNNSIYAVKDLEKPWIKIEALVQDSFVQIRVTDSGTGIPEEKWNNLFDPFFTTKPSEAGTGLGLSISREIAKKHGGDLVYLPNEANTSFQITLPLASAKHIAS